MMHEGVAVRVGWRYSSRVLLGGLSYSLMLCALDADGEKKGFSNMFSESELSSSVLTNLPNLSLRLDMQFKLK